MDNQLTVDQIREGLDSGNLDIINGVLNGTIKPIEASQEQSVVQSTEVANVEQTAPEAVIDPVREEIEQQRRYAELIEQRAKEEKEEYLRKLQEERNNLNKEKQAKEELAQKLQQLELMSNNKSTTVQQQTPQDDEEEAYVSEYTKRTRQMVEELRGTVSNDNPLFKQLSEKLSRLEQEYESEKEQKRSYEEQKRKEKVQEQLFDNIRQFQIKYPELQTKKNVKELNEEYARFRKDIKYVSGATNIQDLEKAIADYYSNGETKQIADKHGIKPIEDYDKFVNIMELIDLKDGIKFDSKAGDYVPILDDNGAQIRYKNIEEAYRVNNFYNEINRVRKQAYSDVNKKLTEFNNSPVTLSNQQTSTFDGGMTVEQARELINMPEREYINNPNKKQMVDNAYRLIGMEPPRSKRRF